VYRRVCWTLTKGDTFLSTKENLDFTVTGAKCNRGELFAEACGGKPAVPWGNAIVTARLTQGDRR
jgi:hypothetical protein